jgi:hypothetical protein
MTSDAKLIAALRGDPCGILTTDMLLAADRLTAMGAALERIAHEDWHWGSGEDHLRKCPGSHARIALGALQGKG